ncbi:MAG: BREX-1 system adenine-specific DNA-methyltransferase PglX, partial [Atopobiaceae bacterium]|nr:BREX-1 system adenine-specific DNA-methyltransferase PglX [Atopobiaceae bacterium]
MDTSKIRALATGAREELRREVEGRLDAVLADGSPERLQDPRAVVELEAAVAERGRDQVVDAAAYTWFNRLCALRFMDANGYNPTPVVTPREGSTLPAILADAAQGVFDPAYGLDRMARDRVAALLMGSVSSANATEDAYATLLRAVCRHYAGPMGYLFSEESASPLLMPQGLLAEGSILRRIVEDMDEEACSSVEVLGWLYQFYIAERKDEYFKSKRKARPDDIAPATQLFTPEYIVRFLTQNSLGRLWMLNNPGSRLADQMEYYIAPKGDEPHVDVDGAEDIRVLDPACGSGHILVYAFDLLFAMYEEEGYNPEDIPQMILERNLRGLEIDPRAAEIAKFALEMKARERDPRFLERDVDADIAVLEPVELEPRELSQTSRALRERTALLDAMAHLGEAGSLYVPDPGDADSIRHELGRLGDPRDDDMFGGLLRRKLETMLANVEALSGAYHCVIANPPYMGSKNMGPWLAGWLKANYPDVKSDLFSSFIQRNIGFAKPDGYLGLMSPFVWMFISSYEKLRHDLITNRTITTLVQLEYSGFAEATVPICFFTLCNAENNHRKGTYIRLTDFVGSSMQAPKTLEAVANPNCPWRYEADAESFKAIPGWPIAYWASEAEIDAFKYFQPLREIAIPRQGLATGDNGRFLRLWWEASLDNIGFGFSSRKDAQLSRLRWFPCNKGGGFHKWYGNNWYIVDWKDDGKEMTAFSGSVIRNSNYYFREGMTWGAISSSALSMRYSPQGFISESKGAMAFADSHDDLIACIALTNSSLVNALMGILAPTLDYHEGPMGRLPAKVDEDRAHVLKLADANISSCRTDWDAFETSWDFESHPLAQPGEPLVERQFERWQQECQSRFDELKANEEELNRIFARIYHMESEVPIEVPDDKVSVRRADLARDVRSLVSYGVGCIFGRYSLDKPGLVLADQGSMVADYLDKVPEPTLVPDADNILPITDAAWFDDDIVDSFYRFLAAAYGEDTLGDNVTFIEGALGCDLRTYFLKHFYADHVRTYQKRPIYWLFQSPRKSFSCLVYMHRYDESTVGEILTGYLRPLQGKLRS